MKLKKLYLMIKIIQNTCRFTVFALLLLFTFKAENLKASHIVGGDLTYQCVSSTPGVYFVEYKWYRDCQGIPMCGCGATGPLDPACSIDLEIVGADGNCAGQSFGRQKLTVVPNTSAYDVIQLCAMSTTICTNCGTRTPGSFTPGIEIYTFRGTINLASLSADQTCCRFNIGFGECCRNSAITTFLNPGGLNFYSGGTLNRCMAPCNSAPAFTNDPVAITCAGQEFTYNLGAIDPDGDSLSYSFGQSLTGPGVSVPYAPPYSAGIPFPVRGVRTPPIPSVTVCDPLLPVFGFCIDPVTGDIRFFPEGNFVANLVIEVRQWKYVNGIPTLAGITRRDIQFYSVPCAANNPPIIRTYDPATGLPITGNRFYTCANKELCLIIAAADDTKGWDTTDLKWNNPITMTSSGATFKPLYNVAQRNVQGPKRDSFMFCWTPPADKATSLPHYFIVTAKDRMCPVPARSSRSFGITVGKIPQAVINKVDKRCGNYEFSFAITNNMTVNNTYTQFRVETAPNSDNYVNYPVGTTPTTSPPPATPPASALIRHKFTRSGWHKIRLRLTNVAPPNQDCPNDRIVDSVFIPELVKVSVRDTFNCFGVPVKVQANSKGGTPFAGFPGFYRYYYYLGDMTSLNLVNKNVASPGGTLADSNAFLNPTNAGNTTKYKIVVADNFGCRDSVPLSIFTRNLPKRELPNSIRICSGASDTLNAGTSDETVGNWTWRKSPAFPVLKDSLSQFIFPSDSGRYYVRKIDTWGCLRIDSSDIFVNKVVPVFAGRNDTICFKDPPLVLRAIGTTAAIDSFQWSKMPITLDSTVISRADTLAVTPDKTSSYRVKGFITYQGVTCSNVDTIIVAVNPLPVIEPISPVILCKTSFSSIILPRVEATNAIDVQNIWTYPLNPTAISGGDQLNTNRLMNLPSESDLYPYGNYINLEIKDKNKCSIRDSLLVAIFPVPRADAGVSRIICDNQATRVLTLPVRVATSNAESWTGRGVVKTSALNTYGFDIDAPDIKFAPDTNILTYTSKVQFFPTMEVVLNPDIKGVYVNSPPNGCPAMDTTVYVVIKTPILNPGVEPFICLSNGVFDLQKEIKQRDTTTNSYWEFAPSDIAYRPALTQRRYFDPGNSVISSPANPLTVPTQFKLLYKNDATGCLVEKPMNVTVTPNPDVKLIVSDSAVCINDAIANFTLYSSISNAEPADISGTTLTANPNNINQSIQVSTGKAILDLSKRDVTAGFYKLYFNYVDPITGCSNADTNQIRIQSPPEIELPSDQILCEYNADLFTIVPVKSPLNPPYSIAWTTPDGTPANIVPGPSAMTYTTSTQDKINKKVTFRASSQFNNFNLPIGTNTFEDACASYPAFDEMVYNIKPKPFADFSYPPGVCVDPGQLDATFTAFPTNVTSPKYFWFEGAVSSTPLNSNPATDNIFSKTYTKAGKTNVFLMVEQDGCYDTASHVVETYPTPIAEFSHLPYTTTIANPYYSFNNESNPNSGLYPSLFYTWNFGKGKPANASDYNAVSPQNVQFPPDTANHYVTLVARNEWGCADTVTYSVKVEPDITVFIPSAFYPNSNVDCKPVSFQDDCNKTFKIVADGIESIDIMVFDRWGQMVFRTNDVKIGWNGTDMKTNQDCQQDAYIYQVNATSSGGKKYSYSGSVILFR